MEIEKIKEELREELREEIEQTKDRRKKRKPIIEIMLIVISLIFSGNMTVNLFEKDSSKELQKGMSELVIESKSQGANIKKLVDKISSIDDLRKCLNDEIKDVRNDYAEAKKELGAVLSTNDIRFSQKLNLKLADVTGGFNEMTDCLIEGAK